MQWRPCRRHSCWNSGLLLWKIRVGNTCGLTFHNHFVLCGNICDCRCNGAMTTLIFRQRNTERLRVTNPTQCDSYFVHLDRPRQRRPCTLFQVHALVEHISPRSTTCLHKTELERKRTRSILQISFLFERKNERERERERASMTGEGSRARFGWPHFIAECNLPSQSSTELEQKS